MARNSKVRIVAAAGAANGAMPGTDVAAKERAASIEAAMIAATEQAMKDGITDPVKILKLKMQAREQAREG